MKTTHAKSGLAWLATVCLALALVACGGSDDPAPPPPSTGQATIGAAGGAVAGPDGVKIIVPEGAFTQDTTVRVARDSSDTPEVGGLRLLTPIYQVTPHGGDFESPARILIPFNPGDRHSDTAPVIIRTQPGADHWEVLPTDVDGGLAAADSFGFSYYAVGECYVAGDYSVGGWDPIASCPSGHTLRLQMRDAGGNPVEILRNNVGTLLPMLTITEPTPVVVQLDWLRPSGTSRTDRIELLVTSRKPAGLVKDLQVNQNTYSLVAGDIIDPSDYTGALAPGGQRVTISAYASYEFNAFYPACLCFRPTSWIYSAKLLLKAVNPGTAPIISQHPANQSVLEGEPASFSVTASGSGLRYQWQRSAPGATAFADLPGETATSHLTPATTLADNGARYRVQVCASGASRPCVDSNPATLSVSKVAVAPSFTLQPASASIVTGQTTSFTVRASGESAPTVQWYRVDSPDHVAVGVACPADPSGTTECHYTTPVLDESDSGSEFYARAENAAGQADSDHVTVSVEPEAVAPSIVSQPADVNTTAGSSASFTVQVSGTAPLSYQWFRDGQPILGANGTTLTLANVTTSDSSARFHVVVSNDAGDATSNLATLTVTAPVCTGPLRIDSLETRAGTPWVALDDAGTMTVVWGQKPTASGDDWMMFASRHASGTGWTGAQQVPDLPTIGNGFRKVAVDGAGNVLVLWQALSGTRVARYSPGTGWGAATDWNGAPATADLALAADGTGMGVLQASYGGGAIHAKHYAGGAWSPDVEITAPGALADHARVAVDGNGNAMAVWRQKVGTSYRLFASHYDADDDSWSAPTQIENLGDNPEEVEIAMNSAGQAVVFWYGSAPNYAVYAARYAPGMGWAAPETLETSTSVNWDGVLEGDESHVAIDDSGNIVAVWVMFTASGEHGGHVHARRYTAGSWSSVAELHAPEGMQAWTVDVALNPAGQGMAVMQEWIADRFAVVGNRVNASGAWSGPQQLAFDTTTNDIYRPRLALNASGGYAAVWEQDSSEIWALHCD